MAGGVRPRVLAREDAVARRRHRVAVQRSRCISYLAVGPLALLLRGLGAVDTSVVDIALIIVAAQLTVVAGWLLASRDLEGRWGIDLWWLWGLTDTLLVSLGVYVSGGLGSPWFMFYLLNMLGAGFVLSVPLAALVAVANTVCYLGVLLFMGHIQAFDAGFGVALARMLVMGTVFAFALQGIVALKHKRMLVRRLKEDESRKVRELTRLTAALDHRTRALADANQRIREADRLKSRFLANMSHELRTPLNSIIGFSEILETRLTNLDPRHAKFLRNIHTSGSHLLGIINDILDLSKVEAGRMELHAERLSFTRLTDGVLAVMKGAATSRGVVLEVDAPADLPELEADPVRAKQILYNLLANAVKFSPDGGTVTVTARALTAEASPLGVAALEFAVIDHGIGIDPKDHELVFQEFRQVDSGSARKYEGTGLGLALVRKFVALHRGELRLESQLGQGSRFIVTLPLKATAGDPASAALPPALPQGTHPTVLVVEDDPTVYEKIAADLERGQYRCVRARTGEEALELVRSQTPAAITLDLVLPGMDGWEVLRQLKQDAATRGVPVVIVSMLDSHELGVALGADGYFVKPPDGDELLRRIAELVPRPAAHLLAIDDDAQVHELLDATLTPRGYTLEHALSGAEGLARAIAAPPDLVILDLMMQGMDGFEVAARLKSAPSTAHVPILVLTAKDLSADERRQLSGHIGALLQKGEARESGRLLETLQELLRRSTTP